MYAVDRYHKFLLEFAELKDKSQLFVFILFDERPTHKSVGTFVSKNFLWLDNLAISTGIFGFAFVKNSSKSRNPSLKIASHFGIKPNQLPGILLFTMLPETNNMAVKEGVFLPIKPELFLQEISIVENVFADVFSACQKVLANTQDQTQIIKLLRKEISSIHRKQKIRPIYNYLGDKLETITKLPDKLFESVADSFGEVVANKIIS